MKRFFYVIQPATPTPAANTSYLINPTTPTTTNAPSVTTNLIWTSLARAPALLGGDVVPPELLVVPLPPPLPATLELLEVAPDDGGEVAVEAPPPAAAPGVVQSAAKS